MLFVTKWACRESNPLPRFKRPEHQPFMLQAHAIQNQAEVNRVELLPGIKPGLLSRKVRQTVIQLTSVYCLGKVGVVGLEPTLDGF